MSCECDHTLYCGLLSASDTASPSVQEIYRRPARRRNHRHVSRRRLLHQHISCPSNFIRSDELTTTSADELSAWCSRRTRSDLPPMGAARYKTDRSRHCLRPPRACPLPAARRASSRHRRTTIVHHPCCLVDPKMCPVMKGSQHQQRLRPEDIDSETMRQTEEIRAHVESYMFQQQRRKSQMDPCQPEATTQIPGAMPQHQSKPMKTAQQSDPREKTCKLCGNTQRFTEQAAQYPQSYLRQPPSRAAGQPFVPADMLTPEVSSETADRLVDELSRRSAGPRANSMPHRVNMGDVTGQQRNPTSAATTNIFPASSTAGLRKGDAAMMTNFKLADMVLNPPLADIHQGRITIQNMPLPRSTTTSPFLEDYYSQRASRLLEHGNEMRPPAPVKTGPPMTQLDVDTSYTMHSIASARAAASKNPDNENTRRYAASGAYSYEEVASQPESVPVNNQQTTRRVVSEGAKPPVDVLFLSSPPKGVFTFGGQDQDDSRNQVGRVEPELRIMPQSDPDSARYTGGTFETDVTELQQTGNHTAASSSNGDYQSGVDNGGGGSLRHMGGVENVLKTNWQASGSDAAQVNGVHPRTDKLSSPGPSVCRPSAAGDMNHLPGRQQVSAQASPSSRKSVTSPIAHKGDGNHQEPDVRKSGNNIHNSPNVFACGDTSVYARHSCVESVTKPDDCGSCSHRSDAKQGEKQQEAASASRVGTLTVENGCKATPNAEGKAMATSPTSRSGSTAASTNTARRRPKDRGDGDAKAVPSESNDVSDLLAIDRHLSVMQQMEVSRKKIMDYIDKALAIIVHSPNTDVNESSSQPKLQSSDQLMGRSKSVVSDSSDTDPQRECSSVELSTELWGHLNATVRESLASLPQQRASKGAPTSAGEDRNNRKLLMKLRRDLQKNILNNLKRLEDIESLLNPTNGEGPSDPPTK